MFRNHINDAPSPGANATNDRGIGAGLFPEGRGERCRTVILPRPSSGRGRPRVVSGPGEGEVVRSTP